MPAPASIPGIVDVMVLRGTRGAAEPDLVIEIPHGATETVDFTRVADRLTSPLPEGLVDFFHVNTDAGAPELAAEAAARLVAADATRTVAILRCRVPRTFLDCNRRLDATPEDFKAGKVTPGTMPWITSPADRALLRDAYDRYVGAVDAAAASLRADGAFLMLHTYAPRTVDVQIDADIVKNLRRAYEPDLAETWPLRPELDVIGRAPDGSDLAPSAVVAALRAALAPLGLTVADSATYPLHPSTLAYHRVLAHPGRALCLAVRRDLLAEPFAPFSQMNIDAGKVARLAGPLATALGRFW